VKRVYLVSETAQVELLVDECKPLHRGGEARIPPVGAEAAP